MKKIISKTPRGQSLVLLMVFMAISITVISAGVAVSIVNAETTGKAVNGELAFHYAESGAEEAVLKIIRDPNYTVSNNIISIGTGTVTINVSGTSEAKIITAEGTEGSFKRKIQVNGGYVNNAFTINSWSEVN